MTQTLCWWQLWMRRVVPRHQTAVLTVKEPVVSKTEEGASGQEWNQKHHGGFLWHLLGWELWIYPPELYWRHWLNVLRRTSSRQRVLWLLNYPTIVLWLSSMTMHLFTVHLKCTSFLPATTVIALYHSYLPDLSSLWFLKLGSFFFCGKGCKIKVQVHGKIINTRVPVVTKTCMRQVLMIIKPWNLECLLTKLLLPPATCKLLLSILHVAHWATWKSWAGGPLNGSTCVTRVSFVSLLRTKMKPHRSSGCPFSREKAMYGNFFVANHWKFLLFIQVKIYF